MTIHNRAGEQGPCGELLFEIERARSRFAVAMAAESKATPLDRWRFYLETDHQIRETVRELRLLRRLGVAGVADWTGMADMLRRPPDAPGAGKVVSEAQLLCRQLRNVMEKLNDRAAGSRLGRLVRDPE